MSIQKVRPRSNKQQSHMQSSERLYVSGYRWSCDDSLPEPDERPNEDPLDRIERLLETASQFLISLPFAAREEVHVPKRFHTRDPREAWTHTKVCRREAEHAWEYLLGMTRAVGEMTHGSN